MTTDTVFPADIESTLWASLQTLFQTGMPGSWVSVDLPAEWMESVEVIVAYIEDLAWHFKREIVVQQTTHLRLVVALVDRSNSMEPTVH